MNVQNIPRSDKVVKAAFCPKLDALFFADFPNIELKLLAFYLEVIGHPSMAEVFRSGADLHKRTASGILGIPEDRLTDEQRQEYGKVPNFSIVYGGGVNTIMQQLSMTAPEALELLRNFHSTWPGIGWQTKRRPADRGTLQWLIQNKIEQRGYITTLWGRHLHPRSDHAALNALIQGCAADLMKWAMIEVHHWVEAESLDSHIVNVVHDELIMDATREEVPLLAEHVPDLMTYDPLEDVVPIRPEPEISWTTWADKEPYDVR